MTVNRHKIGKHRKVKDIIWPDRIQSNLDSYGIIELSSRTIHRIWKHGAWDRLLQNWCDDCWLTTKTNTILLSVEIWGIKSIMIKKTKKQVMTHWFYGHDPETKQHMLKSLPTSEMCVRLVAASLLIVYFLLTSNIFTRNSFPVKLESWNIVCDVNRPDV